MAVNKKIEYWDEPSVASMWAIDYAPYYCNICGEFAGYRPQNAKFIGVCSFKCARKYLDLIRSGEMPYKPQFV